jgi:uncharacterized protein YoxC
MHQEKSMNEITNVSNTGVNADYTHYENTQTTPKKEKEAVESTAEGDIEKIDINELIKKDPNLKAAFDNLMTIVSDPAMKDPEVFTIQRLIASLIDLGQALQGMATAYAERLSKITEKLTAYSKMMTQIPVILKGDMKFDDDSKTDSELRSNANQKFVNMLETVRANKGLEEDKAKKIQTMLQTMKDASTSTHDFIGSFIDLLRGISQKIMR